MLEDHPFEHALDDLPVLRVELADRLELQFEVVVGAAFFLIKKQQIGANGEADGKLSDDFQRGLTGAAKSGTYMDPAPEASPAVLFRTRNKHQSARSCVGNAAPRGRSERADVT